MMHVETLQFQILDRNLLYQVGEIPHHGLLINDFPVRTSQVLIIDNTPRYTIFQFRGTIWYSPLNSIPIDEIVICNTEEMSVRAN